MLIAVLTSIVIIAILEVFIDFTAFSCKDHLEEAGYTANDPS